MLAIYNGRKYTAVTLDALNVGDTFIVEPALVTLHPALGDPVFAETTSIYMKTSEIEGRCCNCVKLNNGEMHCVSNTLPILRVDMKMIWNLKQGE